MGIFELIIMFIKIGAFSFNGGYSIMALLQDETVKKGFLTLAEFSNMIAISQVTPGPVGINLATFIGFRTNGIIGGIVATIAVSIVPLILMIFTTKYMQKFKDAKIKQYALDGMKPVVIATLVITMINMGYPEYFDPIKNIISYKSILFTCVSFIAIYKYKLNVSYIIIGSAVLGIFFF